jgi:hypothetical protein
VCADDRSQLVPNQMEGTWAVIRTRKHHNHIALSFGCTTVLYGDLLEVKCQLANNDVAFQEWTAPPQTTLYTLRSRLLYWWKRVHVSRLALHVLVVTRRTSISNIIAVRTELPM